MPNWTANTIRALGTPQDLRAFLDAVKWEDKVFDFNRILPMPEILKHTGKGCRIIDGQRVESWYVIDNTAAFPKEEHVRRFTVEEEVLLEAIGHHNWYDWSVDNGAPNGTPAIPKSTRAASPMVISKYPLRRHGPSPCRCCKRCARCSRRSRSFARGNTKTTPSAIPSNASPPIAGRAEHDYSLHRHDHPRRLSRGSAARRHGERGFYSHGPAVYCPLQTV
jgi:hypothetical protein